MEMVRTGRQKKYKSFTFLLEGRERELKFKTSSWEFKQIHNTPAGEQRLVGVITQADS
jgi:hypothetical protein